MVLLSPGSSSPTFFEDGYLARYLGYTLVEGADLTVRNEVVYMKTLGGLLPVDVVLRRVPDYDADPLELNPDSTMGTAGLVQASRAGEVTVFNALGTGFLESPVLAAVLPDACRMLLGQELKLPSVPTWWCGRETDLNYVESHLEELTVRHAFVRRGSPSIACARLTVDQRRQLLEQIHRRPEQYIAQSIVERSTAPAWNGKSVEPWRVELRTFAVSGASGYQVMPGGLARVFESQQAVGESMAAGQASKDVWILSEMPVEPVTLLRQPATLVELHRTTTDLPSRVADNLFWLGRRCERAEAMVRHLRSCVVRMTNDLEPSGLSELVELVAALSDERTNLPEPGVAEDPLVLEALRRSVIAWFFEAAHPGALAYTLAALRSTAAQVRDRLSVDSWRIVNQLDLKVLFPWEPQTRRLGDLVPVANQVLNLLIALSGLGTESMTRGLAWRFLDMGRRIERALQTLRLVRRTLVHAAPEAIPLLEAVLEICDSSMTYRYRYRSALQLAPLLDLVIVDDSNPRAVGFQLNALSGHVGNLPVEPGDAGHSLEQQTMLAAQTTIRLSDVEALCEIDPEGNRERLEAFLVQLEEQLRRLSDQITHHYLIHSSPSRQLGMVAAGRREFPRSAP